ncbi:MAG: hypothetical protein LAO07_16430, partial [Acidobacteriia bacterium]|nr:hypothetical protein [Terriglobia bacterium]
VEVRIENSDGLGVTLCCSGLGRRRLRGWGLRARSMFFAWLMGVRVTRMTDGARRGAEEEEALFQESPARVRVDVAHGYSLQQKVPRG